MPNTQLFSNVFSVKKLSPTIFNIIAGALFSPVNVKICFNIKGTLNKRKNFTFYQKQEDEAQKNRTPLSQFGRQIEYLNETSRYN